MRTNLKEVRGQNLWSDEQKPHIRHEIRIRLPDKSKSDNYSKLFHVNVADRWRGRLRSYLGRP